MIDDKVIDEKQETIGMIGVTGALVAGILKAAVQVNQKNLYQEESLIVMAILVLIRFLQAII